MTLRARACAAADRDVVEAFLAQGGSADAWLRHGVVVGGLAGFFGAFEERRPVALVLLRGGALSAARNSTPEGIRALTPVLRSRDPWYSIVGPEAPCSLLAAELAGRRPPRVDRLQVLMSVEDASQLGPDEPRLRSAVPADVDALAPLVARYRFEDGLSGESEDPAGWVRAHLRERVAQGCVYLYEEEGEPVFTGAFNFRGPAGSGLGGIFTAAHARGRGIAARCTARLCRLGLAEGPVVNLHVDERNAPARRCYRRAGLHDDGLFRLTFR